MAASGADGCNARDSVARLSFRNASLFGNGPLMVRRREAIFLHGVVQPLHFHEGCGSGKARGTSLPED